jgi:polyhydroxyalkanoate synthesis repressor PhaR
MLVVKKYGNRRLYDTAESRYITLEELAQKVRGGDEVRVLDAKTEQDLTQATLAQIILESRGAAKLLPVPLLTQLVRLEDEGLAEFFGRFLSVSLEAYLQARQGAQQMAAYNPFAVLPFNAANALASLFGGLGRGAPRDTAPRDEVAELRREVAELRDSLRSKKRRR